MTRLKRPKIENHDDKPIIEMPKVAKRIKKIFVRS